MNRNLVGRDEPLVLFHPVGHHDISCCYVDVVVVVFYNKSHIEKGFGSKEHSCEKKCFYTLNTPKNQFRPSRMTLKINVI